VRRKLAEWAQEVYRISERRAARLMKMVRSSQRYRSRKDPQVPLRRRLKELAATYVRCGYRRLTVLLRREGRRVNAKRIYRLHSEEDLTVRTKQRKKLARRTGYPHGRPGYVVDHLVPLACGGRDDPSNMQWHTQAEAKVKAERKGCR